MRYLIALAVIATLTACGNTSATLRGGSEFAKWQPTKRMLLEDPSLLPIRWVHAESMQLGSFVSGVWTQEGENPPMLVEGSLTTQAGPVNAALGAGGLIGAAVLFDPDADTTSVTQEGGGASAGAASGAVAGSKSESHQKQSQDQKQGQKQYQGQGQLQKQGGGK